MKYIYSIQIADVWNQKQTMNEHESKSERREEKTNERTWLDRKNNIYGNHGEETWNHECEMWTY